MESNNSIINNNLNQSIIKEINLSLNDMPNLINHLKILDNSPKPVKYNIDGLIIYFNSNQKIIGELTYSIEFQKYLEFLDIPNLPTVVSPLINFIDIKQCCYNLINHFDQMDNFSRNLFFKVIIFLNSSFFYCNPNIIIEAYDKILELNKSCDDFDIFLMFAAICTSRQIPNNLDHAFKEILPPKRIIDRPFSNVLYDVIYASIERARRWDIGFQLFKFEIENASISRTKFNFPFSSNCHLCILKCAEMTQNSDFIESFYASAVQNQLSLPPNYFEFMIKFACNSKNHFLLLEVLTDMQIAEISPNMPTLQDIMIYSLNDRNFESFISMFKRICKLDSELKVEIYELLIRSCLVDGANLSFASKLWNILFKNTFFPPQKSKNNSTFFNEERQNDVIDIINKRQFYRMNYPSITCFRYFLAILMINGKIKEFLAVLEFYRKVF